MHAERDIVKNFVMANLSVRLSNAGTVSKRLDISSNFDSLVYASF